MNTPGYRHRREMWPRLVAKYGIPAGLVLATIQGNGWWPTREGAPVAANGAVCGAEGMAAIRETIKERESKGDYRAVNDGSGRAAGAYQFLTDTWNGFGGYATADAAPPEVQDERADQYINDALTKANGDVAMVGPYWYIGHVPSPAEMDQIPYPEAGNTKTVREYQQLWMVTYEQFRKPCASVHLPVPREAITREFEEHHDYPALDIPVPTGTPVYAVTGGNATPINDGECGFGVSIVAESGRWNYCHGSRLINALGKVSAGTLIMESGNTGKSSGPHLHLQVQASGLCVDPRPIIQALKDGQAPPSVSDIPNRKPCG